MSTHYETLGIPREASAERVRRSYRSLVKIYHPDKCASGSEAEAGKRIREINAAYAVLSNPRKRASYDAKLDRQAFRHVEPEHCASQVLAHGQKKSGAMLYVWRDLSLIQSVRSLASNQQTM
jgi:curved DNA-binding protein CbpA